MGDIDRSSISDARKISDIYLPDQETRNEVFEFLANSIVYAHGLNQSNWNLNLDKKGGFIRFNIGQVYCVELFRTYMSILCLREDLLQVYDISSLSIDYKGYSGKTRIVSSSLDNVPDCLVKVPGSVGCHIQYPDVKKYLPRLCRAHYTFIKYGINNTTQLPAMKKAHSTGMVYFLTNSLGRTIPNPVYMVHKQNYLEQREKEERKARKLSNVILKEKAKLEYSNGPKTIEIRTIQYYRSPYVVEYVKRKARGVCQDCKQLAPFNIKGSAEPYLEIHHIVPLSKGGEDSIDNTIALCPNCHRKRHYG